MARQVSWPIVTIALFLLLRFGAWAGPNSADGDSAMGVQFTIATPSSRLIAREIVSPPAGKPVLVLIPGGASTFYGWRELVKQLRDHFDIYLLHPRGFGSESTGTRSTVSAGASEDIKYAIAVDMPAAIAAIRERARATHDGKEPKITLLGTSLGGIIAKAYVAGKILVPSQNQNKPPMLVSDDAVARRRAEIIEELWAVEVPALHDIDHYPWIPGTSFKALVAAVRPLGGVFGGRLRSNLMKLVPSRFFPLVARFVPGAFLNAGSFSDKELKGIQSEVVGDVGQSLLDTVYNWAVNKRFETVDGDNLRDLAESVHTPTTLFVGENSPILDEVVDERLRFPATTPLRTVVHPNTGHIDTAYGSKIAPVLAQQIVEPQTKFCFSREVERLLSGSGP